MKTLELKLDDIIKLTGKNIKTEWCPACRGDGKQPCYRGRMSVESEEKCFRCDGFGRVFEMKVEKNEVAND